MSRVGICLVSLMMIGCATVEKFESNLNSWIGRSESELVARWGIPTATYESSGTKYVVYRRSGGVVVMSQYSEMLGAQLTNASQEWCETTFTVDSVGLIRRWNWRGNSCVAE